MSRTTAKRVWEVAIHDFRDVTDATGARQPRTTREQGKCGFPTRLPVSEKKRFAIRGKQPAPRRPVVIGRLALGVFVASILTPIRLIGIVEQAIADSNRERRTERAIREAAKAVGRPEPRVGGVVPVAVTHDAAGVRAQAQEHFGIYDGLPRYKRMVELGGAASATDVCVIGDEAEVRQRLQGFADAGMTDFLAAPYSTGPDRQADWQRTVDCLAAVAGEIRG